jgi:hypothetical protein
LASELLTLFVFLQSLRLFGLPPAYVLLYWLNPLVIFETFSRGHMDALLVTPLLLCCLAVRRGAPGLAGAALGLAAAIKVWPLMLLPIFLRRFAGAPRAVALVLAATTIVFVLLTLPLLTSINLSHSGLSAYAAEWQRDAFLFRLIESTLAAIGFGEGGAARLVVAGLVGIAAIGLALPTDREGRHAPRRALGLILILLALSPTAYSWYAIWAFALLPLVPSLGAALLAAGGALYLLSFPNALTGTQAPLLLLSLQIFVPALIHFASNRHARSAGHA